MMTRNLRQYGYGGWTWETSEPAIYGMPRTPVTYRTNGRGSGLWECGTHEGREVSAHKDHQILRQALRIIRAEATS